MLEEENSGLKILCLEDNGWTPPRFVLSDYLDAVVVFKSSWRDLYTRWLQGWLEKVVIGDEGLPCSRGRAESLTSEILEDGRVYNASSAK